MNSVFAAGEQKYTINQLLQLHAKQQRKARNYRLTDITSNRNKCTFYKHSDDNQDAVRYRTGVLESEDRGILAKNRKGVDRQNYISVSSPFYKKQPKSDKKQVKYAKLLGRKSEHLDKMGKIFNSTHMYLKKGRINDYQKMKLVDSFQKRSMYQNYHKKHHHTHHSQQYFQYPIRHQLVFEEKTNKCKASCGLFRIKCCNCKPKLDNFNLEFDELLKKRGIWFQIKLKTKDELHQNEIKSYITGKLTQTYLITMDQDQKNHQGKNQRNASKQQLKRIKDKLNRISIDILKILDQYINSLDISKKQKLDLSQWSENLSNLFQREAMRNQLRSKNEKQSKNQDQNIVNIKALENMSEKHLNKIKDRGPQRSRRSKINQKKYESLVGDIRREENNSSIHKSQNNTEVQSKRTLQQKQFSTHHTIKPVGFSSKYLDKQYNRKKNKKKFSNLSMPTSEVSQIQQDADNDSQEQLSKIGSSRYLKKNSHHKQSSVYSGLRDSSIDTKNALNRVDKKNPKRIQIMEQNPQHLKEKQREKEKELISSGALTKRTIKFSTQNQIVLPTSKSQADINKKQHKQEAFINFPEDFEQLCGDCKVKQEPKKIRRRRYGIIHKNLVIDKEKEQFNSFRKQIIRNKKLQCRIQKALKKVNCESSIINNRQARLNINRKVHLMQDIIDNKKNDDIVKALQFYVKIFKRNYNLNRYRLRHRTQDEQAYDLDDDEQKKKQTDDNHQQNVSISQFITNNRKKIIENQNLLFYELQGTKMDEKFEHYRDEDGTVVRENSKKIQCKATKGHYVEYILEQIEIKNKRSIDQIYSAIPSNDRYKKDRCQELNQIDY